MLKTIISIFLAALLVTSVFAAKTDANKPRENTKKKIETFKKELNLTDEQKEAILACGRAFRGFADAMITAMQGTSLVISDITNSLLESLQQPEQDFTKKHKQWKKDRFY